MVSALLVLFTFVVSAFALGLPEHEGYTNVTLSSRAGTYSNPLNQQKGADPCMRYINGKYFLTSTQGTNIAIKTSATVEGLKSAPLQVLFTDSTAGRNFNFWSVSGLLLGRTELHYCFKGLPNSGQYFESSFDDLYRNYHSMIRFLNGNWYIYYAVAGNRDDNTHRLHVLRGGTNPNDPTVGTYTYVNSLIPANFDKWAVDGSILQLNNQLYFVFSGLKTNSPWTQCTYIVKMSNPTTLSGNAVEISCPTFSWETAATPVQEGPEVITVNGVTHIVYSASHCSTDDYALGLLTLSSGADPMVASSWTKGSSPVFTKNTSAGVYGPGHHFMFQKGDSWYFAYHGKSAPGQGCGDVRTTRVQPFSISGSNPVFPAAVATGVAIAEP
ncbi:hypothetical protein VNI00_012153 [Paramarasmius palmivorus]|uniref:Arabinanase/levansucrase/invertase n=1 Tax=Paramarasmius palmivorus TaxID=297713 RepID=A0AAW0C4P0_9AGAR